MQQSQENLIQIIRNASIKRAEQHFGLVPDLKNVDIEELQSPVVSSSLAMIAVAGENIQAIIKVYFNNSEVRGHLKKKLGNSDLATDIRCRDFVKEFCNLIAGRVKQMLELNNILTQISLPVGARGFDEIFFKSTYQEKVVESYWQLVHESYSLYCSAYIELNGESLDISVVDDELLAEDGEIEYI